MTSRVPQGKMRNDSKLEGSFTQPVNADPQPALPTLADAGKYPGQRPDESATDRPESGKRKKDLRERPLQRDTKRICRSYNDKYRRLLNRDIENAASQASEPEEESLAPGHVGMSLWTSDEKETFFLSLASLGKDNIKGIASKIGTKSELEVSFYLQCLKLGLRKHNLHAPRVNISDARDFPAAAEISQQCCDGLDQAAKFLEDHQQRHEELSEQKKEPDLWILNRETANWIEEELNHGKTSLKQNKIDAPEFALLKLGNWLELSDEVFMNPASASQKEENWLNIAENDEEPSILRQAFKDFHSLTISILKRLVQASLFCAMSRLRATDTPKFSQGPLVKPKDVHAACKSLRMKTSATEFWVSAPRRCRLDVYEHRSGSKPESIRKVRLGYDEVERRLSGSDSGSRQSGRGESSEEEVMTETQTQEDSSNNEESALPQMHPELDNDRNPGDVTPVILDPSSTQPELRSDTESGSQRSSGSQEVGEVSGSSDEELVDLHTRHGRIQYKARQELEHAQDVFMEAIDQRASVQEERLLWTILGKRPEPGFDPENIQMPPKPTKRRLRIDELVDWRDRLDYWSEWERRQTRLPDTLFLDNLALQRHNRPHGFERKRAYSRSKRRDKQPIAGGLMEVAEHSIADNSETDHEDVDVSDAKSPAKILHLRPPRPPRTRSVPQSMPGMIPTASAIELSEAEGQLPHRAPNQQEMDDEEDEDKDYDES